MAYRNLSGLIGVVSALMVALPACGGGQEKPAESPEPSVMPEAPAASETPAEAGEQHTMPDGTTMPGAEHGDHSDGSSPAPAEPVPNP